VPLVFRGEAAGLKDGGAVETHLHEIVVGCPADHVIEEHRVDVSSLAVGDTIYVRDLVLPTGIVMVSDTDLAVVGCRMHRADVPEPVAPGVPVEGEAAPAQPEVIAEKKREEREKTKEEE
jgi:large subunit ribosomal protein L25